MEYSYRDSTATWKGRAAPAYQQRFLFRCLGDHCTRMRILQTVDFDAFLPEVMAAWKGVAKHRVAHIHLAFDQYCSTFQAKTTQK